MQGSDKVIAGLIDLMGSLNTCFDSLHDQEHRWEQLGYGDLEKWWDKANRSIWKLHHKALKRVFALGGDVGTTDDPVRAFTLALTALNALHAQCQDLYALAEADGDYVTGDKVLTTIQAELESMINSTERKLGQLATLKPANPITPFMTEQM